jgi:hypothetical protein
MVMKGNPQRARPTAASGCASNASKYRNAIDGYGSLSVEPTIGGVLLQGRDRGNNHKVYLTALCQSSELKANCRVESQSLPTPPPKREVAGRVSDGREPSAAACPAAVLRGGGDPFVSIAAQKQNRQVEN